MMNVSAETFTVWVGGVEVNDRLLTHAKAQALANGYIDADYDDVHVVNVSAETDDGAVYTVWVDGSIITGFRGNVHEASKLATYWAERGYTDVTLMLENWEDVYGRVPMISAERFHVEVRNP